MKYKKTAILRSENDETSPEITVSTVGKCSGRERKMIKLWVTEGADSPHTNSLFQRGNSHRKWPGGGGRGQVPRAGERKEALTTLAAAEERQDGRILFLSRQVLG